MRRGERMSDGAFRALPLDKWRWRPSPVAGQIVYATTTGRDGATDLALKSWVSMAAFAGPVIGLGCRRRHRTCRNATATGRLTLSFGRIERIAVRREVCDLPASEAYARPAPAFLLEAGLTAGLGPVRRCADG